MGCGAVCGNNSSILQPNNYSQNILFKIVPRLNQSKQFISTKQFQSFLRQIKQNPLKYRLKTNNKLVSKQQIDPGILTKWKVILFCLQNSNPYYNNCLGQNGRKINGKNQDLPIQYNGVDLNNEQDDDYILNQQFQIYPHKQFTQIQKDIDRTCQLSDSKKKTFERILKRITNHFPSMGYTQGINFIVGYLLTIGYSQFQVFWIFVHIAINPRYLLLGLFEDGFPLSDIYKGIFKNILKRQNTQLYNHLYNELNIDQSVWVFKWFFTYFIYSFPHQMIKFVFDIVIQIGGIGLIKFAVAISQQISKYLLNENDVCQISIFFQSLKDIDTFNHYISMNKVIEKAYKLQIKKQDYQFLYINPTRNFYVQYLITSLQQNEAYKGQATLQKVEMTNTTNSEEIIRHKVNLGSQINQSYSKTQQLLNKWYQKLIKQRQKFRSNFSKEKETLDDKNQRYINQNKLKISFQSISQKDIKSPEKQQSSIKQYKNSNKDSNQIKNYTIPSTGYSLNKKSYRSRQEQMVIDQLLQQEQKNSSISRNISSQISQQSRTQNGFNTKIRKISYQDELDKFASTSNNGIGKKKINFSKAPSIFNAQKQPNYKPKINNFQISTEKSKTNNLVRAGRCIVNNSSITEQSIHQSQNSQNSKFSQKQKKQKQNDIYGKGYYRSKKEISYQNQKQQLKSIDKNSSSKDSGFDPINSIRISNQSIQDQLRNQQLQTFSMKAFQSNRQRISTQQDIGISSMHVSQIKQSTPSKQIQISNNSQIQIFQAQQVFKKRNRVSSRINGAIGSAAFQHKKLTKLAHKTSEAGIQKGEKIIKTMPEGIDLHLNYQQSCQSIFDPCQRQKSTNSRIKQQMQQCQIESVK